MKPLDTMLLTGVDPSPIKSGVPEGCDPPVFLVSPARSGSTLLRYILDSHSRIVAPQETNIVEAASKLMHSWMALDEAPSEAHRRDRGLRAVRALIYDFADFYCQRSGKTRLCDKSLSTADYFGVLLEALPEAQFVTLYRNPMDMIASGVEACRWGYTGFGFTPYVSPLNTAASLATYWCERIGNMMALERQAPERTVRVYYEHLVAEPEAVVCDICDGIGVPFEPEMIVTAFTNLHFDGAGDVNADFANSIHHNSIGKGAAVPVDRISEPLLERMNSLLVTLQYPEIGRDWNTRPLGKSGSGSSARSRQAFEHHLADLAGAIQMAPSSETSTMAIVFDDASFRRALLIDFAHQRVEPMDPEELNCPTRILLSTDTFGQLMAGNADVAAMIQRGAIRITGPNGVGLRGLKAIFHLLNSAPRPSCELTA